MERGEGERLHAQRRKHFWLIILGLGAIGFVAGLLSGVIEDLSDGGAAGLDPRMATAAAAGVILAAIASVYGSYRFFVSVDEVEVADNLWGSLIGFYAYAILLPVWWALEKLGRAPEPDQWLIYGASMIVALAAYGYRKVRFHFG
jgi:hypothetical protein